MAALIDTAGTLRDGGFALVNFVDFDTLFGHRRDVPGYADALEQFDRMLPDFLDMLRPGDLAVFTADHGCDPTWRGSDHTREMVPVLATGPVLPAKYIGLRQFDDIAQSIALHLGIPPVGEGWAWQTLVPPDAH